MIRVAIAYAVAAWVLLQVADLVLDAMEAPALVMRVFMLALGLLFPLVIAFSWAFEVTPEGIKREKDVDRTQSITHETARRLDRLTIGMLALVLVLFAFDRLSAPTGVATPRTDAGQPEASRSDSAAATARTTVPDKSVAVLAFRDLSPAGDQGFFADGVAEEILNVVAQIPDIQVAGRTSSFAFKNSDKSAREIGELLQVAHILEGSVRKSGERIRVTAQLVKAADGYQLFSKNYDRELTDIFAVQDDIARMVAAELHSTIFAGERTDLSAATGPAVYEKYLRARQWLHTRNRMLMEQASALLDEALAEDPDYTPALVQKALATLLLSDAAGAYGDIPVVESLATAASLLAAALALEPANADAWAVKGLLHLTAGPTQFEAAMSALQQATALNPSLANANNWLAALLQYQGHVREAVARSEAVIAHDPLYAPAFDAVANHYISTGSHDRARSLLERFEQMGGNVVSAHGLRARLLHAEGRLADALREFEAGLTINPDHQVLLGDYCGLSVQLGLYERAASSCTAEWRLMPLALLGHHDDARRWLAALEQRPPDYTALGLIAAYFEAGRNYQGLVDHLARRLPGGEVADLLPGPNDLSGFSLALYVAHALRQTGRDHEATTLLATAEKHYAQQIDDGADNFHFWHSAAQLAALQRDGESLIRRLQRLIETGGSAVRGFDSAVFDAYRKDPTFEVLEQESRRRANAERARLGIEPVVSEPDGAGAGALTES